MRKIKLRRVGVNDRLSIRCAVEGVRGRQRWVEEM